MILLGCLCHTGGGTLFVLYSYWHVGSVPVHCTWARNTHKHKQGIFSHVAISDAFIVARVPLPASGHCCHRYGDGGSKNAVYAKDDPYLNNATTVRRQRWQRPQWGPQMNGGKKEREREQESENHKTILLFIGTDRTSCYASMCVRARQYMCVRIGLVYLSQKKTIKIWQIINYAVFTITHLGGVRVCVKDGARHIFNICIGGGKGH